MQLASQPARHDTVSIARSVLLLVAVAVTLWHCQLFDGLFIDDAGISFAYSRSLAEGHGLILSPGSEHVEGYSNFLWVILCGCGMALGADVFTFAHLLGAACSVATTLLAAELTARLRGRRSLLDALPAAMCAALTPLVYFAMSGLESGLFTALLLASAHASVGELREPRRFPLSAPLVAAVALTRPDGLIYVALAGALRLLGPRRPQKLLVWAALAGLPIAAHLLWRYSYYAYPFPNTYYAKSGRDVEALRDLWILASPGWDYVRRNVERYALLPMFAASLLAFVRLRDLKLRFVPLAFLGGTVFFAIYAGGDWMSEGRFLAPGLPFVFVLAMDGSERLAAWLRRVRVPGWAQELAAAAVMIALAVGPIGQARTHTPERVAITPPTVQRMAPRGLEYRRLADLLAIEAPTTLDGNAGGIGFYAGMPMYDLGRLVDVTLAHDRRDPAIVMESTFHERRPTFVYVGGVWRGNQLPSLDAFWQEYLEVPQKGGAVTAMTISRRVFLADGIDPRAPLARFDGAGVDLLGIEEDGATRVLYLLARRDRPGPLTLRTAAGEAPFRFAEDLFPTARWLAGEIVRARVALEARELCGGPACVALAGTAGARPVALPPPDRDVLERATARGELRLALALRRRLGLAVDDLLAALEARGDAARAAGATDDAFRDLGAVLAVDRARPFARRHLEELRFLPRDTRHVNDDRRLAAALRAFRLLPTAATLDHLAARAHDAGESGELVRAHLVTGLMPSSAMGRLELAEALVGHGLGEPAAAALPAIAELALPGDAARFMRVAALAGREDLAAAARPRLERSRVAIGGGRELTAAWGRPLRSGLVAVSLATRDVARADLDVETRVLAVTGGAQPLRVGDATLTLSATRLAQDFETGDLAGWSVAGRAFAQQPIAWRFPDKALGYRGTRFIGTYRPTARAKGELVSGAIDPRVDEVCLLIAGGDAAAGIEVSVLEGQTVIASGAGRNSWVMREMCLPLPRGAVARRLRIRDAGDGPWSFVLVDDITCRSADRELPCAGGVAIATP